jgi:hypothetical protein
MQLSGEGHGDTDVGDRIGKKWTDPRVFKEQSHCPCY